LLPRQQTDTISCKMADNEDNFVFAAAHSLFFDPALVEAFMDSDEEDDVPGRRIPKVDDYYNTVRSMDDLTFKQHFRLSMATFFALLQKLIPLLMKCV
jgi:hypothetical protein